MFHLNQLLTSKTHINPFWKGAIFKVEELITPALLGCAVLNSHPLYRIDKRLLIPSSLLKPCTTIKEL